MGNGFSFKDVETLRGTTSDWAIARSIAALTAEEVTTIAVAASTYDNVTVNKAKPAVEAIRKFSTIITDPLSVDDDGLDAEMFGLPEIQDAGEHFAETIIPVTIMSATQLRPVGFEVSAERAQSMKQFDSALAHLTNLDADGDTFVEHHYTVEEVRDALNQVKTFTVEDEVENAIYQVVMHMANPDHATDADAIEAIAEWFAEEFPDADADAFNEMVSRVINDATIEARI